MTTRIFFYGLYMDSGLLQSMGLRPRVVGAARLDDYQLRICRRATLVPARGKSSYGFLHELEPGEAEALYSRPEVRGYVPQAVKVTLLANAAVHDADCYVLESEETDAAPDADYATRLAALVARLGLPPHYARQIERLGESA